MLKIWCLFAAVVLGAQMAWASTTELGNVWALGDSITSGQNSLGEIPGGWRDPFVTAMKNDGYGFQMVGTQTSNDTPALDAAGQQYHEGHAGFTVAQLDADLGYWVTPGAYLPATGANPNLILLMAGSTDISQGLLPGAGARLSSLITDLSNDDPGAHIIVSTIIPQLGGYEADRETYNGQIYADVKAADALGENVQFADIGDLINANTDMIDALHPNAAGEAILAQGWETAITDPAALASYPVPEPGSIAIVSVAGLLAIRRRRDCKSAA